MTTSSRRPSPAARAARRSRRPAPRSQSFLERNRSRLLWIGGALVLVLLVGMGYLNATRPAYACAETFTPSPTPEWVPPSVAPVASGATAAPALTPPPPGLVQPDSGKGHAVTGTTVRYALCPPASGKHYNGAGVGPIAPQVYGPEDQADPPSWVHNLEHGGIVLLYKCPGDACTEAGQKALSDLFARWPATPVCKIPAGQNVAPVIARFDDMPSAYTAIVWDVVLPMEAIDETMLFDFWAGHGERFNPEPQCAAPTAVPPTAGPATPTPAPTVGPSGAPSTAPSGSPAPASPAGTTAPSPS